MDSGVATEKNECGGVEGPEAMYVKLIASDGHEFIMKRSHALTSGTIKAMLSGPGEFCFLNFRELIKIKIMSSIVGQFSENETNEVKFREIP